jgi:hypothetical protein
MGAGFWIRRFCAAFGAMYLFLLAVERIKGHSWEASLRFSASWALLSASIFVGTRLYYASLGQACPMCRDIPEQG